MTADQMKLWRQSVGWDQATMASRLGVTVWTVSRWENGANIPRRVVLQLEALHPIAVDEVM